MNASHASRIRLILGISFLLPLMVVRLGYADSADSDDGVDKTYYWQGTQLNNLSRLANTSPDFEETQRRARFDKTKDSYLATIRAQMSHQAATDASKKTLLMQNGQLQGDPLEVVYTPAGINVTLHADMLFSDNTTAVKIGTVDVLERLRVILQKAGERPLHFIIADRLDEIPNASSVDAERTQMIVALLNFSDKDKTSPEENLTPEPLAPQ